MRSFHRDNIFFLFQGSLGMFGAGYMIQAAIKLFSSAGKVLKHPKSVIQALINWNNTKLGAFLAGFIGIYRVSHSQYEA